MTIENNLNGNTNHELIGIPTKDGVKNIHPDSLKQYKQDAFEHLDDLVEAQGNFKELMETIEEVTGIPKGDMGKYFKAKHKAKTKEAKLLGETFEALDAALPDPQQNGGQ